MVAGLTVWATAELPGFHRWPGAPDHRAYLRDRHRHLFKLRVEVQVHHDERDIEFHDLSDAMRYWWSTWTDGVHEGVAEWGPHSCEAIATELSEYLGAQGTLDHREWMIEVSEDGESGARLRGLGKP